MAFSRHPIVAASFRLPENKVKTDRSDARTITIVLKNANISEVYVPNTEDEPMLDLIRIRTDMINNLKSAKQRSNSLLLAETWSGISR